MFLNRALRRKTHQQAQTSAQPAGGGAAPVREVDVIGRHEAFSWVWGERRTFAPCELDELRVALGAHRACCVPRSTCAVDWLAIDIEGCCIKVRATGHVPGFLRLLFTSRGDIRFPRHLFEPLYPSIDPIKRLMGKTVRADGVFVYRHWSRKPFFASLASCCELSRAQDLLSDHLADLVPHGDGDYAMCGRSRKLHFRFPDLVYEDLSLSDLICILMHAKEIYEELVRHAQGECQTQR